MKDNLNPLRATRRRGSIYIAVLGTSLIAVTLAVGGVLTARVKMRAGNRGDDVAQARLAAESGMQLAKLWIAQDANWRTTRTAGNWTSGLSVGSGTVTINVVDPVDGNLSNRPHDPVTITVTAGKGSAQQILSATLQANPVALPTLAYAMHSPGQLHLHSGDRVTAGTAIFSTNASLRNDGIMEATVVAGSIVTAGLVYGGVTTTTAARPTPTSAVADLYAALGVELSGVTAIDKRVLAAGYSSYGTASADGVYVIRSGSDVLIRNSRINGTLVVLAPGKKVTLDSSVCIQAARPDYPALIVVGDLVLSFDGVGNVLSEAGNGVNFNPTGAPYNGVVDTDLLDTYPSEIKGLVFATGPVAIKTDVVIRGAVISGSTATTDAVDIAANPTFIHDGTLMTNPPQGFTSSVPMSVTAGTYKQIVN